MTLLLIEKKSGALKRLEDVKSFCVSASYQNNKRKTIIVNYEDNPIETTYLQKDFEIWGCR